MALKQPVRRPPLRGKPNQQDPAVEHTRKKGALLGLAVGDALGSTQEGKRLPTPPFPQLVTGFHTEMKGGGASQLRPGQVTDDTQMACCVAQSLQSITKLEPMDVAKRYLSWRQHAFDCPPEVAKTLEEMMGGRLYQTAAKLSWLRSARQYATNGSLSRTAPIGVFFAKDDQARAEASLQESALTHFDPRCQLACAALNGAIARAITQVKPLKPEDLVDGAISGMAMAGAIFARMDEAQEFAREAQYATSVLREDLEAAQREDPMLYGPELHLFTQISFVRVTFRYAFWLLFHAPSFEAALVDVVNRGGDADTNAAVAGALLGAYHGADQIPERWSKAVLEASPAQRGPLHDLYHPRVLLTMLDVS